jgi:hypothetical protein
MMTIMNLFSHLMKLSPRNNHGDMQPQVTISLEPMHLHQLQHLLVFKTNHPTPISIRRWNSSNYSTSWNSFVTSNKNPLIN